MNRVNRNLAVAAIVLFLLSAWVYRASVHRADRFERGQEFLSNLNPDEIAEIVITKGSDVVSMKRDEDKFVITSADGYPAKNEAVNRLIKAAAELSLEKEVGSSADLAEELELVAGGENTTEVVFKNATGKEMVHFLVGKKSESAGSYICSFSSEPTPVFLTDKAVYLNTGKASFIAKEILNVERDDIESIQGRDYRVAKVTEGGGLTLQAVPPGQQEKATGMNQIRGVLSYLNFDEVFLADDETVRDLMFRPFIQVDLSDSTGYRLAMAEGEGESYLKITGFSTIQQLLVDRDETQEELEDKAQLLARLNEIEEFNTFHGSWVYRVNEATAKKISLTLADLIEVPTQPALS